MSSPLAASARIADSRPAPGPLTFTSTRAHAMLLRELRRVLRRDLRRERSALARSLESDAAGARPREDVPHRIGDGHDRVVERRGDRCHAVRNVLPLFLLRSGAALRCSGLLPFCSSCFVVVAVGCRVSNLISWWPSSCRRSRPCAVPCACGRSCACAGRGPAGRGDDACRGSS